jgi:hypothetical protein
MSTTLASFAGMGLFFLLIFMFGFRLTRSGRPYHRTLFTIHKLSALAAVIFLAVTFQRFDRSEHLGPAQASAMVIASLVMAGLFATGALMSIDSGAGLARLGRAARTGLVTTHRILPYLAVLSTGTGLYLLTR